MDKSETIQQKTQELLTKMGVTAEVTVNFENDTYKVTLQSESNAPILIGRHGETLASMQRVLEAMLFKQYQEAVNVLLNVNDYREKQTERLQGIAENVAERVIREKRGVALSSFSAFERKIIHEYISKNHPELVSHSEGEGFDRKLHIDLKEETTPES